MNSDTLIFRAKGLRRPGVPVIYCNEAVASVGSGVIVPAPPEEDPKDVKLLVFWEGNLIATRDPTQVAFTNLVGTMLGQADGYGLRVTVPWCLEIDLSLVEGRQAAIDWLHGNGDTTLTVEAEPDVIRAACWRVVRDTTDNPEDYEVEG